MAGTLLRSMARHLEWWHYVVCLLVLLQIAFFLIPQTRPGLLGVVCWWFGSDRLLWLGITALLLLCALGWSVWHRPFWSWWRAGGYLAIVALTISPLAFRTYPSSFDDKPSSVRFRLPLDGPVTVAWGGATPDVNYHVIAPEQRWAYDLVVAKDGKTFRRDGKTCEDYYCYGLAVLAPADGTVHAVSDGEPDMPIGVMGGGKDAGGNQVVLEVAPNEFLFLCHLQPGSITVKKGDRVTAGQVVGRVGNSGNTSEPHLHIHLQHGPDPDFAEGIPLYFHNYRVGDLFVDRGMPTGGATGDRWKGQLVEHVGQPSDRSGK
ncbi:MAG: M23 family metallopeptidase [Gemmataceae bacterium]|nr:M23 family metallopeptidase [Gemmataceae bacterium]